MSDLPTSPIRHFRSTGPFSKDEAKWVILKYEELKSVQNVRRAFRKQFYPSHPKKVPGRWAFERLLERFKDTGSLKPEKPTGRRPITKEQVDEVEKFFKTNPDAHVREASERLNIGFGTVWKILRRKLKWKPYRQHMSQPLSLQNKKLRLQACKFWLTHDVEWFERVLWSDEKWFALQHDPNRKNDVMWAPSNPHLLAECKSRHGQKVMAWLGVVDGRCLLHWFTGSVNGDSYLHMLQTVVWPAIRHRATARQLWFQHDGAPPHVTTSVMDFLRSKFGNRIISRKSDNIWPPYSPDLTCLDFSLWSNISSKVYKTQPATIEQLKKTVEEVVGNLTAESLRKAVRHTRRRAELCVAQKGGHFEHLL